MALLKILQITQLDQLGLITLNSAPGANVAVAWNGTYYYRCRFTDDSLDFNNAMRGLWDLQKLGFTGSVKNKV